MCGITGFSDSKTSRTQSGNDRLLDLMTDSITHRGPDAGGQWSDRSAGVWLGHRRLAIVDVTEAGAQPMTSPDGRAVIVYNGEIYNAPELRDELSAAGYGFRGHSDTEVLLYGCLHWGVEATLRRLIGMFAFALWDVHEQTLTLAADRLGKKPIYWAMNRGAFLFGSELQPLMLHPDCPTEIDRASVADYLRTAYILAPYSIFEGVSKIEPGQILTFDTRTQRVSTSIYWSVLEAAEAGMRDPFLGSAEDAVDAAGSLLNDAVRRRMVADVSLGAFLSGGIDSSAVVALMQQNSSRPVRTFSIGYASGEYDESADAARVAAHLGTDHSTFMVEASDALAVIPELPHLFDEPFGDVSQIPTYLVSKMARRHVTVALTGDGGDEVFAGYNRHVAAGGLLSRLRGLPEPAKRGLAAAITALPPAKWQSLLSVMPTRLQPRSVGEKLHKLAATLTLSERDQYRSLASYWEHPETLVPGAPDRLGSLYDVAGLAALPDPVARMRFLDFITYLPGDILTKVDRATMAASLESRAPLLDHRLVELSWRIPSKLHLHQGKGKWILRQILDRLVPSELVDRPKMGFAMPIGDWLRGPLRDWAESLLSRQILEAAGLVEAGPVRQLWADHLSGRTNGQYKLWAVLMLQAWHAAHVSGRARQRAA